MQPRIYFASDHAGYELKNELIVLVRDILGYAVEDLGAYAYDENDDFTDYIVKAAREVSANPDGAKAIILGGSGQGEAMLANRFNGVRATVFYGGQEEIITLSRVHNDANVLSIGARFVTQEEIRSAVALWLHTEHPPVEKYDRRIREIDELSSNPSNRVPPVSTLELSIAPSLPAQTFVEIEKLCEALDGVAKEVQIDIVDGVFAPFTSWPFTETDPSQALLKLEAYEDFEIEIDCMCVAPEKYLDIFASLGVKRVVIHAGSTEKYDACIAHAQTHGYDIGIGILNSTSLDLIKKYVEHIDFVQVMGIEKIGAQGQPFDEKTYDTVATLRHLYPQLEIVVDGGVNETTILKLRDAGANRFAPGSAVAKSSDPAASYTQLASMIGL